MNAQQWVYTFGGDRTQGRAEMRDLLGGKGANLAEMAAIGLPVPPGFTITTAVCTHFYNNAETYPTDLRDAVVAALAHIETATGARFGDAAQPLLVSVRSGARASMPGMMDTVLNLGLNDETVLGLARHDERFAWDSYRRFIQMYGDVVLGVDHYAFEDILDTHKRDAGAASDQALSVADLKSIVSAYKALVLRELGAPFPMDVQEQLWGAIGAVFKSWMTPRAITYRTIHDIPADWGTAVNVQAMVFGNMGDDCATGVAFTRDPSTGENVFYGEYLLNAQGEDVVAGIRTPLPLARMAQDMPDVHAQLCQVRETLERHYRDMQDIEFTVQRGTLYMLQTRTGKRSAAAALKIAVDMVAEKLIDMGEALLRIDPAALDQLLHPRLDPVAHKVVLARGLPASPGAACGVAVFTADEAEMRAGRGETVILCRRETSPEDIHGMHAAAGILTSRGGMTSHAAVVARGMGRPCVAGAGSVHIDSAAAHMTIGERVIRDGEIITIDGSTGELIDGAVPTVEPELSGDFATIMGWADGVRRMRVRANAETPLDAKTARGFGAEGIGLCRTEHMFFDPTRIRAVREMILCNNAPARRDALAKLLPAQRGDFIDLFTIMEGLPVTIRLLDPPLHEFLPHGDAELADLAAGMALGVDQLKKRLNDLHEANPMLGHRGCRLAITYPEIYEMQARAIFEAAIETGAQPEIMIPLIATAAEFSILKKLIDDTAETVFAEAGRRVDYSVGTMIELPRAALCAGEIAAAGAAFFSFGTNDLTQTTLGLSRDDAGNFLPDYMRQNIFSRDPFATLDVDGVGQLVKLAAERGRAISPDQKLGICGEHGGDPDSIDFCERVGLDYVSCSPYRIPIARLAAAQAHLRQKALGARQPDRREAA